MLSVPNPAPLTEDVLLPGLNGIPFRKSANEEVPFIKENDPQHKRPVVVRDGKTKIFDLLKKDDLDEYNKVIDEIAKGRSVFSSEEAAHWYEDAAGNLHCYKVIRWLELKLEMPKGRTESTSGENTIYE